MSVKLRKRFCSLTGMPQNMLQSPYFENRLWMYGKASQYQSYINDVEQAGGEEKYLQLYNDVKEQAIQFIKSSEGFERFQTEDMNKFSVPNLQVKKSDIFQDTFVGHKIVSLDMRQANFQALRYYSSDIFGGADTWKIFLRNFTDVESFLNSKYMRQVIMGACNPKRQVTYEKYLLYRALEPELQQLMEYMVAFMHDEVIFDLEKADNDMRMNIHNSLDRVREMSSISLKREEYTLHKIKGTTGYLKQGYGWYQIKGVSDTDYPFVYRKLRNENPEEEDYYFTFQDRLAKMIEIPQIEILEIA